MIVSMDGRPKGKPDVKKQETPKQRQVQADMHRWSRTNNATVQKHGADGRAGI